MASLKALQPELCITAAYGNILPTKFLNIPPLGLSMVFLLTNLEICLSSSYF